MVSEPGFEGEVDMGFVRFVVISAGHRGLVYDRFHEALAREWAFVGFLQLHSSLFSLSASKRMDLLWPSILCLMLGIQG